jgi:hypothetical protein
LIQDTYTAAVAWSSALGQSASLLLLPLRGTLLTRLLNLEQLRGVHASQGHLDFPNFLEKHLAATLFALLLPGWG